MTTPENKLDELFENAKKYIELFMTEENRIQVLELFKKHAPEMIKDKNLKMIKSEDHSNPKINDLVVPKATFEKDYHLQNIKPKDEANIKPKDKANIKPKDKANIKPKDVANIKPKDKVNIKPKDKANIKPKDEANIKLKDKVNIKPKDEANIKPKDEVNINKKLEMPNNTKNNAELVAKENKKIIINQNDFSKANNKITGKENPIIDNKRDKIINGISNLKKYFNSKIDKAAVPKINIEDKVIFERPKPSIVEKIERIERINKNIDSGSPEYKPNITEFSEFAITQPEDKKAINHKVGAENKF